MLAAVLHANTCIRIDVIWNPRTDVLLGFKERCACTVQGGLYENVSPEVMASARLLLTGNPAADADIIKFYQAKAALMNAQPLPLQLA